LRTSKDNGSVVTSGNIRDKTWYNVGVESSASGGSGYSDNVNDKGTMGGSLDWLSQIENLFDKGRKRKHLTLLQVWSRGPILRR